MCFGDLNRQIPSMLEYFSYNYSFLTFLAGPTVACKEYQDFVFGENYAIPKKSKVRSNAPFSKHMCTMNYVGSWFIQYSVSVVYFHI